MKKLLLALAPLLALVAFAVAPLAALAHAHHKDGPCRVLAAWPTEPAAGKCAEPPGVSKEEDQNLREEEVGAATTPGSTDFPTQALLVNTKSKLRGFTTITGVRIGDESPTGDAMYGMRLTSNPTNSATFCRAATGTMTFADVQNGKPSEMFNGTSAWLLTVFADSKPCEEQHRAGEVTIREVSVVFDQLEVEKRPVVATGTLLGSYSQPDKELCPAGGIELDVDQLGISTEPESERKELDGGEEGKPAFLCVVASNNYVFPKTAPTWAPFTNSTEKEGIGIWSTKEP
jgi:hypothetical protein